MTAPEHWMESGYCGCGSGESYDVCACGEVVVPYPLSDDPAMPVSAVELASQVA